MFYCIFFMEDGSSLVAHTVKNLPTMRKTWVWPLGWEEPLEEGMATHSSIPAWRIPWTEEPGRLQSMGVTRSWTWLSAHWLVSLLWVNATQFGQFGRFGKFPPPPLLLFKMASESTRCFCGLMAVREGSLRSTWVFDCPLEFSEICWGWLATGHY